MLNLEKKQKRQQIPSRKRNVRLILRVLIIGLVVLTLIFGIGQFLGYLHRTSEPGVDQLLSRPNLLGHSRPDKDYQVMGISTISVDFINQVLDLYASPAAGKGQALYDLGVQDGVDPIYALAFFMHESTFGTTGVAQVTLSLGNIRATPGYESYDGYRKYKTWEDGFKDWYKLIKEQYVGKWKLSTVEQIVPVYAPSSDNNDVTAYIQAVKQAVDSWRNGQVQVG